MNDSWAVNDKVSVNLGIRAEKVASDATSGIDSSLVVPRLAVAFDLLGDGRYTFQATYSHYAGKYSENQVSLNTNVDIQDELQSIYVGPSGQGVDFEPGFDPANYVTISGFFPTQNIFLDDNLKSPRTKEVTVSAGGALGERGYAKLTYINRRAGDFVEDFVTLAGGSTTITGSSGQQFGTFPNIIFQNTDALERNYDGLEFQGRYQVTDNFLIDGSYSAQLRNEGNFEGEARNQPAISTAAFNYPEVTPENRYFPLGRLDNFQRHKVRVWSIYNLELGSAGVVDIGGVWRYNSGVPTASGRTSMPLRPSRRSSLTSAMSTLLGSARSTSHRVVGRRRSTATDCSISRSTTASRSGIRSARGSNSSCSTP